MWNDFRSCSDLPCCNKDGKASKARWFDGFALFFPSVSSCFLFLFFFLLFSFVFVPFVPVLGVDWIFLLLFFVWF